MPNNDWMNSFSNRTDLTLAKITFPASHDAGLSEGDDCYHPIHQKLASVATGVRNAITPTQGHKSAKHDTICQFYNVAGQLQAGSRAFDVRCALRHNETRTIHAEGGAAGKAGGGYGQRVRFIVREINDFLVANPSEIVILRISHTNAEVGERVCDIIHQELPRARRYLSVFPINVATVPLNQLRGKAVIIFHADALPEAKPHRGLHRFARFDPDATTHEGLEFCGDYAGFFGKTADIAKFAFEAGNEHAALSHRAHTRPHLYMIYWQEAFDVKHKTVEGGDNTRTRKNNKGYLAPHDRKHIDLYRGVHYNLSYLLNVYRGATQAPVGGVSSNCQPGTRLSFQPNWINLDFVDEEVCNRVIDFNAEMLAERLAGV